MKPQKDEWINKGDKEKWEKYKKKMRNRQYVCNEHPRYHKGCSICEYVKKTNAHSE